MFCSKRYCSAWMREKLERAIFRPIKSFFIRWPNFDASRPKLLRHASADARTIFGIILASLSFPSRCTDLPVTFQSSLDLQSACISFFRHQPPVRTIEPNNRRDLVSQLGLCTTMPQSTTPGPGREASVTSRVTRSRTRASDITSAGLSTGNATGGSTDARRPVRIVVINRPVWPATYRDPSPSTSTSTEAESSSSDDENDAAPQIVVPNITAETMDFAARLRANNRHIGEWYINHVRMPPDHPQNSVPANVTHTRGITQPQTTVDADGNVVYHGHSTASAELTHEENGVITIEISPDRIDDYLFGDALAEHGLETQGWEFHIYDDSGTFVQDGRRIRRTDTQEGTVPMEFTFFGRRHLQPRPREVVDLTQNNNGSDGNQRCEEDENRDSDEVQDPEQYACLERMVDEARELAARLEAEGWRATE
ncbi:hypothetical protein V8F20_008326 [Naviculisporaceae sp. PSN 640]